MAAVAGGSQNQDDPQPGPSNVDIQGPIASIKLNMEFPFRDTTCQSDAKELSGCNFQTSAVIAGGNMKIYLTCSPKFQPPKDWVLSTIVVQLLLKDNAGTVPPSKTFNLKFLKSDMPANTGHIQKLLMDKSLGLFPFLSGCPLELSLRLYHFTEVELDADLPVKMDLQEPWKGSDVILEVEDRQIHAHRQVLSVASTVFNDLLNEADQDASHSPLTIPLPDKGYSSFVRFLSLIYPGQVNARNMHFAWATDVLPLAHEYKVPELERVAVNVLKENVDRASAMKVIRLGYMTNHEDLTAAGIRLIISRPTTEIIDDPIFEKELPTEVKLFIMEQKALKMDEVVSGGNPGSLMLSPTTIERIKDLVNRSRAVGFNQTS